MPTYPIILTTEAATKAFITSLDGCANIPVVVPPTVASGEAGKIGLKDQVRTNYYSSWTLIPEEKNLMYHFAVSTTGPYVDYRLGAEVSAEVLKWMPDPDSCSESGSDNVYDPDLEEREEDEDDGEVGGADGHAPSTTANGGSAAASADGSKPPVVREQKPVVTAQEWATAITKADIERILAAHVQGTDIVAEDNRSAGAKAQRRESRQAARSGGTEAHGVHDNRKPAVVCGTIKPSAPQKAGVTAYQVVPTPIVDLEALTNHYKAAAKANEELTKKLEKSATENTELLQKNAEAHTRIKELEDEAAQQRAVIEDLSARLAGLMMSPVASRVAATPQTVAAGAAAAASSSPCAIAAVLDYGDDDNVDEATFAERLAKVLDDRRKYNDEAWMKAHKLGKKSREYELFMLRENTLSSRMKRALEKEKQLAADLVADAAATAAAAMTPAAEVDGARAHDTPEVRVAAVRAVGRGAKVAHIATIFNRDEKSIRNWVAIGEEKLLAEKIVNRAAPVTDAIIAIVKPFFEGRSDANAPQFAEIFDEIKAKWPANQPLPHRSTIQEAISRTDYAPRKACVRDNLTTNQKATRYNFCPENYSVFNRLIGDEQLVADYAVKRRAWRACIGRKADDPEAYDRARTEWEAVEKVMNVKLAVIMSGITFSDEKWFSTNRCSHYVYVHKDSEYIPSRSKNRHPPKIMLWMGITYGSHTRPMWLKPGTNISSETYATFLLDGFFNDKDQPLTRIFMEDGAGPHSPQKVDGIFTARGKAHLLKLFSRMKWPPYSPDLNPIENVWGWMEHQKAAYRGQLHNADDIRTFCDKLVASPAFQDVVNKNILSFYARIFDVMEAKGERLYK